jgi:hypothetical protein
VDGVDWVVVADGGDGVRFVSYGLRPALEVWVPAGYGRENATAALVDLASAVAGLPVTRTCVGG